MKNLCAIIVSYNGENCIKDNIDNIKDEVDRIIIILTVSSVICSKFFIVFSLDPLSIIIILSTSSFIFSILIRYTKSKWGKIIILLIATLYCFYNISKTINAGASTMQLYAPYKSIFLMNNIYNNQWNKYLSKFFPHRCFYNIFL